MGSFATTKAKEAAADPTAQTMGRTVVVSMHVLERLRPDVAAFCRSHLDTPPLAVVRENGDVHALEQLYFHTGAVIEVARSALPLVTGDELGGDDWLDELYKEAIL